MPEVRRGLIVRATLSPVRRRLASRLADPHFLAVELPALGKPWVAQRAERLPGLQLDDPTAGRARAS